MLVKAAIALTLLVVGISSRPEPPVNQQYLPPDQQYGPPQRNGGPSNGGSGNSGFGSFAAGTGGYSQPGQSGPSAGAPFAPDQYLPPNQQYGPPGAGGNGAGYDDGSNNGPVKYDFEYMVNDLASGNDFGHKENRDGELTRGVYYVLLPDGRRQTVEYEADQNGYRPKVTYVQEGPGIGSGNNNNNNGNNGGGYPSGNNGYRY